MILHQIIWSGIMLVLLFLLPLMPQRTMSRQAVTTTKVVKKKGSQINGIK